MTFECPPGKQRSFSPTQLIQEFEVVTTFDLRI